MPEEMLKVAVTVATRDRPEGCRRLVERLLDQEVPDSWEMRVVVVDNDPQGSELQLPYDQRLEVLHEPDPGIPFARNRGVERVLPWADVICFIDDDESPGGSWLRDLVSGLERYGADVVSGPVRPVFEPNTPRWLTEHPVFTRPGRQPGADLRETYTANTAVRANVFRSGLRFDSEFHNTGGSDTHLFRQAHRGGARIRWVAEAMIDEYVPPERARVRWVLARSFRIGANRVQFLRAGAASGRPTAMLIGGSAGELLLGLGAPLVAAFSRKHALAMLGRAARGLGTFSALLGVRYAAYR